MDHAEAIARIADLALEPGRLAAVAGDPSPEAALLRAHLDACPACAAELAAWHRTWSAIGGRDADDRVRITAPPSLRTQTLLMVAAEARAPDSRVGRARRLRAWPWLAAAAVIVLALGATGFGLLRGSEAERIRTENAGLVAATAALGDVLADPAHWVASLGAVDGDATGTVAWTDDDIVVVTSGLPALGPGQAYRCWVERDGGRTPIGPMALSGSTGYWVGSSGGWRNLLGPGATFGVSVTTQDGTSSPVLLGEL